MVVREETSCEELTVRGCQDGTLERAKRSAVEQVSAVLLTSETVTEELFSTGTMAGDVHVTNTIDRIKSQVRGVLIRYEVLDKGWVGETSYFYEIEAVVKGQISRDDFFEMLGLEGTPVPPAQDRSTAPMRLGAVFRDCDECPEMVVVPAGTYLMGSPVSENRRRDSEGPQHRVTFDEPFAVGIYEVTFAEWDACTADGGCGGYRPDDEGWGRGDRPVIGINWNDAQSYVTWLSDETGAEYGLLREADWEYVARAGTVTPFHTGQTISPDQANYNGGFTYGSGRRGLYRRQTVPVGTFPANGFGLHDVHGNVSEWVQDCWSDTYVRASADGSALEQRACIRRVVRGGHWRLSPKFLRSASRTWFDSSFRGVLVGFRVARTHRP